jgi:hypothetical protein
MKPTFQQIGPGQYAASQGNIYLGLIVKYGKEWDCWFGAHGLSTLRRQNIERRNREPNNPEGFRQRPNRTDGECQEGNHVGETNAEGL